MADRPYMTVASRVGINLLILLGVIIALYLGRSIFIPLVIAVLLAALVWPAAYFLHKGLRFTWAFSCFLVVFGLVVLNLAVTIGFLVAIPKMVQDIPNLTTDYGQKQAYEKIHNRVSLLLPPDERYFPNDPEESKAFAYVKQTLENGTYVANFLWTIGSYSNSWFWQWVLVTFVLLFLLVDGQMLSRRVVEIFGPSKEAQAKAIETLAEMARAVRVFLVWRTLVNFALAVVCGLAYQWIFGLRQPWLWALLTAVACYVPYLGPIVAGVPPLLDAFFNSEIGYVHWYVLGVFVFYVVVITLEGYVLVPVVMGRSMELNATTVMLACLFWELVWGLPGLFLAMPLMAAVKAICAHVPGWRPWANLMGTEKAEIALEKARPLSRPDLKLEDTQLLSPEEAEAIATQQRSQ
jgi:predicted PurR-regulated permease PerM